MAQNTQDIRRRIQGIGSIMQITNAMELVASAKLRKSRENLEKTKPYFETVYKNINSVLGISNTKSDLMTEREIKNRAIILISSDKGLAGGYNINIVNEVLNKLKLEDNINTEIYTTGVRAVDILRRKGIIANTDWTYISEKPTMDEAVSIGAYFSNKYIEGIYDEVLIAYTKFNSVISLEPQIVKLLPVKGFTNDDKVSKVEFDFEPSPEVVLTQMIKQYVNVTIYGCLLESSTSEQASRRTAMENATENGEELLEDLRLEYNRARQASITQEISEIVGGAEALS